MEIDPHRRVRWRNGDRADVCLRAGKIRGFRHTAAARPMARSQFIGQQVTNNAGETIGNINDLLFEKSGRIANVVIGVGGFLGIGEKNVAIAYGALGITADANGKRVLTLETSKERLRAAPDFKATEKTTYMRAKEQATDMGQRAAEKARELKDKAAKKIDDIRGPKSN